METFVLVDSCMLPSTAWLCLCAKFDIATLGDFLQLSKILSSVDRVTLHFDVFCYRAQVPDTKKPREETPFHVKLGE